MALTKIKEALFDSIHSGTLFPFTTRGKLDTAIKTWKEKIVEYEEKKSHLKISLEKQAEIIENYAQLMDELGNINDSLIKLESNYFKWKIDRDNVYRKEIEKLEKRNQELKDVKPLLSFYINFENLKPEEQQFIILYENEMQSLLQNLRLKQQRQREITGLSRKIYFLSILLALLSIIAGFINKTFFYTITICIPLLFLFR